MFQAALYAARMKKLRAYLDLTGMSQSELARRMGVSQPTVWAWVHGETMPSIENLRQLSAITNMSIDDLVALENNEAAA